MTDKSVLRLEGGAQRAQSVIPDSHRMAVTCWTLAWEPTHE